MNRFIIIICALFCALSLQSCDPKIEDDPIFDMIGSWKYSGHEATGEDDIDIFYYYLFEISADKIRIYGMNRTELTEEYTYTRNGNTVTFSPAFIGKYKTAEIGEAFGSSTQGMYWKCGTKQEYFFDRK